MLAFEVLRHVLQRLDVGGDVLSFESIATGGGSDQRAVLVAQRHGQPIDLRLGAEGDFLVVAQSEKTADTSDEIDDVLLAEGIVEREHRDRVTHLGETARRRGADPER